MTPEMQKFFAERIAFIRSIMTHDNACDQIVPSDLRMLVGELDRLNAKLEREVEDAFERGQLSTLPT